MATVFLRVRDDVITELKVKVFGCLAAKAACSVITELAKDKKINEALAITRNDVSNALGGIHKLKMHVAELAEDCLHAAVRNYLDTHG